MILEFVDAEPVSRMIEGINGGARPDRAVRANRSSRNETAFVKPVILAGDDIRPNLCVPVHIQGAVNGRAEYARPRTDAHDVAQLNEASCIVFKLIDKNSGEFHFATTPLTASRPNAVGSYTTTDRLWQSGS